MARAVSRQHLTVRRTSDMYDITRGISYFFRSPPPPPCLTFLRTLFELFRLATDFKLVFVHLPTHTRSKGRLTNHNTRRI